MKIVFSKAFLKLFQEVATDKIFAATGHQRVLHGVQYCRRPPESSAGFARPNEARCGKNLRLTEKLLIAVNYLDSEQTLRIGSQSVKIPHYLAEIFDVE